MPDGKSRLTFIMGLGNPGARYVRTRHNMGFRVVERLAERSGNAPFRRTGSYMLGRATVGGKEAALVKPLTFMNLSGAAVVDLTRRYGPVEPRDLIVIYDDLDLPLGRLRIRPSGSSGGHKGVQSVIEALGTDTIPRVRIGIRPQDGAVDDPVSFVLDAFEEGEAALAETMVGLGAEAVAVMVAAGVSRAMNRFNRPLRLEEDRRPATGVLSPGDVGKKEDV